MTGPSSMNEQVSGEVNQRCTMKGRDREKMKRNSRNVKKYRRMMMMSIVMMIMMTINTFKMRRRKMQDTFIFSVHLLIRRTKRKKRK